MTPRLPVDTPTDTFADTPVNARPRRFWLITALALLIFAAGIGLGRWQLSRAARKEALQAGIQAQSAQPPLDLIDFLAAQDTGTELLHRTVRLRGQWRAGATVYLDNRQMQGLQGFDVLTPLALDGADQTVLVQRGWVQRNFEQRASLPPVLTPSGIVEIVGRVAPPPGRLFELGQGATAVPPSAGAAGAEVGRVPGSSAIRQNLDLEAFKAETRFPLRTDVTLRQTGAASEGLRRDWTAPTLGVEKHYGYAFQWFGLAALVAILYVWFQFIVPRRRARHAHVSHVSHS